MSYNNPQDGQDWRPEEQPTVINPVVNQPGQAPQHPPGAVNQPPVNPYPSAAANQPPQNPYAAQGPGYQTPQNPYQTQGWPGGNPYGQYYAESSNAIIALMLSILGAVCCCTFMAPVGLYLGKSEMNAIDQGVRDPAQRGTAQAAFIVGIVGTVILVLGILYYVGIFVSGFA